MLAECLRHRKNADYSAKETRPLLKFKVVQPSLIHFMLKTN